MILTSYFSGISSSIDDHLSVITTLSLSLSTCAYCTSPHHSEKWSLQVATPSISNVCFHPLSSCARSELLPRGPDTRPTRQWLEKLTLAYFMAIPGFALALTTHDVVASWPCVISESWRE